jgi:hypothetical protein
MTYAQAQSARIARAREAGLAYTPPSSKRRGDFSKRVSAGRPGGVKSPQAFEAGTALVPMRRFFNRSMKNQILSTRRAARRIPTSHSTWATLSRLEPVRHTHMISPTDCFRMAHAARRPCRRRLS